MHGSISAFIVASEVHLPPVSLPKPARGDGVGSSQPPVPFVVGSSKECNYEVSAPGWEAEHVAFVWSRRYATWTVKNLSNAPLFVGNHSLDHAQELPLLVEDAVITSEGVALHFLRNPSVPRCGEAADGSFPLPAIGMVIGRGPAKSEAQTASRLELDPDILSISSQQAEVRRDGRDFVLVNHNKDASGRTLVNGDQNFDERKLILGDCIQIPNCDYYTFKFTGTALRHLGEGGRLQGSGLMVDVKTRQGRKRILHPVNLELRRGEFLGIIGGSGQGKSTLMNALCGIVPATAGSVSVDGLALRSPREVARVGIGYVPQDDIVHRELTVEQALSYAARLRLKATALQTQDLLEATMETLHLTEHREKRIANLSGGQRKRVSIASELLVSPDYIFLDEPTSGLDPWMEQELMGVLSALAQRRRIGVVCTTHVLQNCHVLSHMAFISRGRLISYGKPAEVVRFFIQASNPEGAKKKRERSSASTSSGSRGVNDSPYPRSVRGDGEFEFDEADLLGKIGKIYPIAQDMGKTPDEQDLVAAAWEKEYHALAGYRLLPPAPSAAKALPRPPVRVGVLRSLFLLISRQWKILVSARMNYLFLAAQAVVIGLLISWVDANVVLQMFLSLIATLWFGCSNGATQIVAELPIFRRERLAGLGINTYLLSKFTFLTAITGFQALILFLMVLCGTALFHPAEPDPAGPRPDQFGHVPDKATIIFHEGFFDGKWDDLAKGDDSHPADSPPESDAPATPSNKDKDFGVVGLDVDANNRPVQGNSRTVPRRIHINPTGLHIADPQYRLLERLAWFFHVRQNVMDSLGLRSVELQPGESPAARAEMENGTISWILFLVDLIGLRLIALLAAAVVGVGLGLAVSSLVDTTTQAVMWVPLILIPQILFGSFVVIVPEMDSEVLAFSNALPSFNLQRAMDVALIYGRAVPHITNQTKIPAFLESVPSEQEIVKFDGQQTKYNKLAEVNKSWQNLTVIRAWLGAREQIIAAGSREPTQSVDERRDVSLARGDHYLNLEPAYRSFLILAGWALGCYVLAAIALFRRQTGR